MAVMNNCIKRSQRYIRIPDMLSDLEKPSSFLMHFIRTQHKSVSRYRLPSGKSLGKSHYCSSYLDGHAATYTRVLIV